MGQLAVTGIAHHYTFLEGVNGAMGFHRIDELMEPLVALPDRCDARLAVTRTGSEAPELGQAPHRLAQRRRSLRRGAVLRHGINGLPLLGLTHELAGRIRIGAASHGNMVDPPGYNEIERHGVQQPLIRLQA